VNASGKVVGVILAEYQESGYGFIHLVPVDEIYSVLRRAGVQ
jgi:hypothetical protein